MFVLPNFAFLWSQIVLPGIPGWFRPTMAWLIAFGDPSQNPEGLLGAAMSWLKVVSLLSLLGWAASWIAAALKERLVARGNLIDIAALLGICGGVGATLLQVLEATKRVNPIVVGGLPLVTLLALISGLILFLWLEAALWTTIRRLGNGSDLSVLVGIHLGLALGIALVFFYRQGFNAQAVKPEMRITWQNALVTGVQFGATYMGYVVLARVLGIVLAEILAIRFQRLYSIARLSVVESNRRMWAPWVVITVFLVILAFTHWFLQPPRAAEMGRLFVGTLTLLCSLLLTLMVTLLTPLSLPQDIQNQTIYTVVSKPVRRIELIWGRMLGFMTIVTVLILVFGGISLFYLWRTVGGKISEIETLAVKEAGRPDRAPQARALREQSDQLRTRMAARVPIRGSLIFLDSRGNRHLRGIDVGQEQSMREPRSHIEGATPATAIWRYGIVADPYDERRALDRRIPVDLLLTRGTIEEILNRSLELKQKIAQAQQEQAKPNLTATRNAQLTSALARDRDALAAVESEYNQRVAEAKSLEEKATTAEKAGEAQQAQTYRAQEAALHSKPIPLQMTFNVYRTTKGRIGEPVYAELEVSNPATGKEFRNIFAIREYYTNKQFVPAECLAGSRGALTIEIRCISPTQYLGMAESDLYILAHSGDFGTNFMKGLFGVWLQAMVLTAIGVFAGTFLSWPVALLTTIAFFVAGQVAFAFLLEFSKASMLGGGPFESLIRLLSHDNMMSELTPTLAVVTAKTLDALVMPIMSRLVFVVPNFSALDVSNTVADGFAVSWRLLGLNTLLALAYALPFSIAGYFILKNREVAA